MFLIERKRDTGHKSYTYIYPFRYYYYYPVQKNPPQKRLQMLTSKKIRIRIQERSNYTNLNFDESWSIIKKAVDKVYEKRTREISFEETYRIVYSLANNSKAEELYKKLQQYLTEKLKSLRVSRFEDSQSDRDDWQFVDEVAKFWEEQLNCFKLIGDLMVYIDKVYCKYARIPEIMDVGLLIFRDTVLIPIRSKLTSSLILCINSIRHCGSGGSSHDDDKFKIETLQQVVSMMETIPEEGKDFFKISFEGRFLEATGTYYSALLKSWSLPPAEAFQRIKEVIQFEHSLDKKFLNEDSCHRVNSTLEKALIWDNLQSIIFPLVQRALRDTDFDLNDIYNLPGERECRKEVRNMIETVILEDLQGIKPDESIKKRSSIGYKWFSAVLASYERYESLLAKVQFRNDGDNGNAEVNENRNGNELDNSSSNGGTTTADDGNVSGTASTNANGAIKASTQMVTTTVTGILRSVYSRYLKENASQSVQLTCYYLDQTLKTTKGSQTLQEIKNCLRKSAAIFQLLSEKDEFEMLYRTQLSKRLLQQKSSVEVERFMLTLIRNEMGSLFTYKMETMIRDISTSNGIATSFNKRNSPPTTAVAGGDIEFFPQILTRTSWPFENLESLCNENIVIPEVLESIKLNFEDFYRRKYNERQLKWAHSLGLLEIGYQFEKSYHILAMPVYAGLIFLLFEEHDELTVEQIAEMTRIPEQELKIQLLSLTLSSRCRILGKSPASKTISMSDKIFINKSFTAPTLRVKTQTIIGNLQVTRQPSGGKNGPEEALEKERSNELNAAIVRILKADRTLDRETLFERSKDAVKSRFTLKASTFTRSINYLMNKEYIRVDSDGNSGNNKSEVGSSAMLYHYVP